MKIFLKFLVLTLIIFVTYTSVQAEENVLQQRSIQTRYYDTTDSTLVFKAVINTLQDNGYTITNIEPEVGFIRARTDGKKKRTNRGFVALKSANVAFRTALLTANAFLGVTDAESAMIIANDSMWIKNELQAKTIIQDINVVISKYEKQTRVRISLQEKVMENADGYCYVVVAPRSITWILDELTYQNLFSELNKSLYLEGQKLSL